MRQLLLNSVEDWVLFASILRFGENYMEKVVTNAERESERHTHDKISLFLEKYKVRARSSLIILIINIF